MASLPYIGQSGAGSPFKPDGINNPFSPYGSPFSNQSATNPFATDAPRLYDQQGNYRGELSANPAGLSGSFGLFSLSGFLVSSVLRSVTKINETTKQLDKPVLDLPSKTDQIDQINEMDQFRLSLQPRPSD